MAGEMQSTVQGQFIRALGKTVRHINHFLFNYLYCTEEWHWVHQMGRWKVLRRGIHGNILDGFMFQEDKRHGRGTFYDFGVTYRGEWKSDKR